MTDLNVPEDPTKIINGFDQPFLLHEEALKKKRPITFGNFFHRRAGLYSSKKPITTVVPIFVYPLRFTIHLLQKKTI